MDPRQVRRTGDTRYITFPTILVPKNEWLAIIVTSVTEPPTRGLMFPKNHQKPGWVPRVFVHLFPVVSRVWRLVRVTLVTLDL